MTALQIRGKPRPGKAVQATTEIWGRKGRRTPSCLKTLSCQNKVRSMKIFTWLTSGSCQADQGVPRLPAKQPPCACCKPTAAHQARTACPPAFRLRLNQISVFVCRDLFPRMLRMKLPPSLMFLQQAETAAAHAPGKKMKFTSR